MGALRAIIDQFQSFFPGNRQIDGGPLAVMANQLFSVSKSPGLVALPGGGASGAPMISAAFTIISTVASAGDSILLPPAIPGQAIFILNKTANDCYCWGLPSNPNNDGLADQVFINLTGLPLVSHGTIFAKGLEIATCFEAGVWVI